MYDIAAKGTLSGSFTRMSISYYSASIGLRQAKHRLQLRLQLVVFTESIQRGKR